MSRKFYTRIAIAILVIQVFACRKPVEPVDKMEPVSGNPPRNDYRTCRITQITTRGRQPYETRTGIINYNLDGTPTGITFDTCWVYHPQIEFRYDAEGRLSDYIASLTGCGGANYFEAWYQYQHDSEDRIIGDTLITWGQNVDGVPVYDPGFSRKSYATYEYDDQDRIIAVSRTSFGTTNVTRDEYFYTVNGNRAWKVSYHNGVRGSIELYGPYDTKVNFLRTHKVWMFVTGDYSLNNKITASGYNAYNLPVKFSMESYYDHSFLHGVKIDRADIAYKCKAAQ